MFPTYRAAQLSDLEILLQFMQELYAFDRLPFDCEGACAALEGILQDSSLGEVWLIQLAEKPIGYVVLTLGYSLEFLGRDAFVDELYIQAAYRRQGIGSKTLKFVEDRCKELGVKALHLEVERENTQAQAVYRKVGFEDHDRYLLTKWIKE
ncbi:MAG: GNAT family N-acetyltransferase [Leptolyngbyaceae cyanobacterium MO_188.B28]|nr:GNAT family N-acetyltransferase [Leptolyngbyaceae cyanobacterium MO_188.B28]